MSESTGITPRSPVFIPAYRRARTPLRASIIDQQELQQQGLGSLEQHLAHSGPLFTLPLRDDTLAIFWLCIQSVANTPLALSWEGGVGLCQKSCHANVHPCLKPPLAGIMCDEVPCLGGCSPDSLEYEDDDEGDEEIPHGIDWSSCQSAFPGARLFACGVLSVCAIYRDNQLIKVEIGIGCSTSQQSKLIIQASDGLFISYPRDAPYQEFQESVLV